MSSESNREVPKLKRLPSGGTIGIFSPSSPVESEKLERGVKYLESLGYKTHLTPSCSLEDDYIAGSGKERASDLMSLVSDPKIDAVFSTRGGFGSIMMIPHLDYDEIRRQRKLILGFSDVTAIHWAIWCKAKLPAISAGMVGTDLAKIERNPMFEENFWKLLESGEINFRQDHTQEKKEQFNGFSLPGTMSVGAMLLGSSYFPDTSGSVMILEDVFEPRHKVEAYLQQYRLAGVFDNISGMVLGEFTPAEVEEYPKIPSYEKIFDRTFSGIDAPVVQNFPYGHIPQKTALPVGAKVTLSLGPESYLKSQESIFERGT